MNPAASAVTAAPESLYSTLQDRGTAKGPPKSFKIAQDVACRGLDCGFSNFLQAIQPHHSAMRMHFNEMQLFGHATKPVLN